MKVIDEKSGEDRHFFILICTLLTGLVCVFSWGVSGNDFWWHVKAGEWMVNNRALPTIDVFSWYAKENGMVWVSHEWLSQVFFYVIHHLGGDIGIFILSLISAAVMAMLILKRNEQAIRKNIALSTVFLAPLIILSRFMFYGRPHLISYFLMYATLSCLYRYKQNESSNAIYAVPFIAILWGNLHGGSSTLSYILCFLFMFSGLFEFSVGKLHAEKHSRKQLYTYLVVGLLSIAALAVNPYGLDMLIYPYANMGDAFMQKMINEWSAPDAKQLSHLILFYWPLLVASLCFVVTDKKIKAIDLLVFLFFAYMLFRSVRFGIVFYIASTFFIFDYFIPGKAKPLETKYDMKIYYLILIALLGVNVFSIATTVKTIKDGKLISVILSKKFIDLVKAESPKRLFNDYTFGEALIYNDVETFVDARADLFSSYNLRDTRSLSNLVQSNEKEKSQIFDPDKIIAKYQFDAFLIRSNISLAVYLRSMPEKYKILMEDERAVYFKRIDAR